MGRIQQMRDPAVDPHRGHVVAPHLEPVTPAGARIVMEDPVEGGPGADALGGITRHPCPIDRTRGRARWRTPRATPHEAPRTAGAGGTARTLTQPRPAPPR